MPKASLIDKVMRAFNYKPTSEWGRRLTFGDLQKLTVKEFCMLLRVHESDFSADDRPARLAREVEHRRARFRDCDAGQLKQSLIPPKGRPGLPAGTASAVRRASIFSMVAVQGLTDEEILALPGLGRVTLNRLRTAQATYEGR